MEINNFTHYKFEGWLPNDWEVKDAADVCIKITDGTHDTPKVVDSGIPFITAIHVKKGKIDFDNCLYISEEEHEKIYKRCNPSKGDLLVVNIGAGVAEYAFVETDKEFSLKNVALLKPNSDLLHDKYLCYHHAYKKENIAHRVKSGGAQPFLSLKELRKLKIVLPPLPEQQKIAKILSTWDKAISTTELLIENSTQQKSALMQQLLTGKKRLLDESGKRFAGEFNQHRLSELVNIDKKSLGKNTLEDYEFEYISLSDVSTGTISKSLERHVFSSAPSRARRIVKENDLLLATVRPNLKGFAKAKKEHDGFVASTGFAVLSAKKDVSSDYVYHYLFSHHLTGQINALVVGSNYPAINSSDVGSLKILCPPLEEQQKIATVLTNADKEIELLEQQLADLQQEKKALMQVLLTGKKRVTLEELE